MLARTEQVMMAMQQQQVRSLLSLLTCGAVTSFSANGEETTTSDFYRIAREIEAEVLADAAAANYHAEFCNFVLPFDLVTGTKTKA